MLVHDDTYRVPSPGIHGIDIRAGATTGIQGAVIAYSAEIMFRCAAKKLDSCNESIRIFKFLTAACMFIKTIIFMTFSTPRPINCRANTKTADLFYHLSMVAGSIVLLLRIRAVLPPGIALRMNIVNGLIVLTRLGIGIVDVILLGSVETDTELCLYLENSFWGPVYTFYDTAIDLYVTIVIAFFLSRHIRRLRTARTQGNIPSYIGIVMQNVFRTTILSIANLVSAIFILRGTSHHGIMVVWPIVNMLFVLLIGYDADLAQAMRQLHLAIRKSEYPPQHLPAMGTHLECPSCGHRRSSDDTVSTTALSNRRWRRPQRPSRTPSFLSSSLGSSLTSSQSTPTYSNFQMHCPDESVPHFPPSNTPSSEIRIKLSPASTVTDPLDCHQDYFSARSLTPPYPPKNTHTRKHF